MVLLYGCTSHPHVEIETSLGSIVIEIYQNKAPLTAGNFLKYVDEHRYDQAVFYRVVNKNNQSGDNIKIDVIQGGLYKEHHPLELKPILHESTKQTGVLHKNGTISMARLEPGTASSEFFICIGDQPELDYGGKRNADGQGFAAFGRVIKGMELIKKIHVLNNTNQILDDPIIINTMRRL